MDVLLFKVSILLILIALLLLIGIVILHFKKKRESKNEVQNDMVDKIKEERIVAKKDDIQDAEMKNKLQSAIEKANGGDVEAMFVAGLIYKYTYNDKEHYFEWLEKAANAGHTRAMVYLGQGFSKENNKQTKNSSWGLGYSKEKYLYWIQQAADMGDPRSILELSFFYSEEENDELEAYKYLEMAWQRAVENEELDVAINAAKMLADKHDVNWNLSGEETELEKAEFYYEFILTIKIDEEEYPTYEDNYLNAAVQIGILYFNLRGKKGWSERTDRLAAYSLSLAAYRDMDGIYSGRINAPLEDLKSIISPDDKEKWKVHAQHCAYLPNTIIS